jgi:LCP family protein required for cell wall assembly
MRSKRRKKRSYKRVVALGIILLSIAAGIVAAAWLKGGIHQNRQVKDGMMAGSSEVHIMIMGVDRRSDDVGRSDTLMVATVDPAKKKAGLFSVPRDTRVQIEGNGYDKINAAYAYGGHALTEKTVEQLLGVPMDYYVLIDIHAFERIIDALGGVDVKVEKRMHYEDPWDDDGGLVIDLYPGEQHMDGKKAIQYVRYRDGEGDIGRIGRQQKFMKAVLEKVISPQILPRLPQLIEEVASAVQSDMSVQDMVKFANLMKDFHDNGLEVEMLPGKPAYLSDISYWLPDIKGLRQMIAEQLGLPFTGDIAAAADAAAAEYEKSLPQGINVLEDEKENGRQDKDEAAKPQQISVLIINSSGINGAGARAADILKHKGFRISGVETGRTSSREQTTITTATENTGIFYGMPFKCTIMSGGEKSQAVVNIGRDFKK